MGGFRRGRIEGDDVRYAEKTSVPVLKTRLEIETTAAKYGADAFAHATDTDRAMIQFRIKGLMVRFLLPLADKWKDGSPRVLQEQQVRQRWRALLLTVKAKLEAVETGIETIEHAFMAEIVMLNGRTLGEEWAPQIRQLIEAKQMPTNLLLGYAERT